MYVAATDSGEVLELSFPGLLPLRRLALFSRQEHVNSVAPLEPGLLWVVLHRMGPVRKWLEILRTFSIACRDTGFSFRVLYSCDVMPKAGAPVGGAAQHGLAPAQTQGIKIG